MNELTPMLNHVQAVITDVGLKVLGAVALWIVGRWLIRFAISLTTRALAAQQVDRTLLSYLSSSISVVLNIALVVAILIVGLPS